MIRLAGLIALVSLLSACGVTNPDAADKYTHPRQEPSNLTPGVHLSGEVKIGLSKRL